MSFLTAVTRYQNETTMQNSEKSGFKGIPLYNNRNSGNSIAEFGCDKLKIYLNQDQFAWEKGRLKGWGRKIIETDSGESEEFFYNPKELHFNLDIAKDERSQKTYCSITTNPSKKLHAYNLTNNVDVITEHLGNIENHLKEKHGVIIDLEKAKVSRYDLAHNMLLNHSIENYKSVLSSFRPKRQIAKTHADSFYWTNKSRQGIFYNKTQELTDFGYKDIPNNLVRMENRMLNSSAVKTSFEGNNLLSNILTKMDDNPRIYNQFIRDRLFRQQNVPTLKLDFGEFEFMYENAILQWGTKEGHRIAIESFGIHQLVKIENGIQFFNNLIDKFQKPRTAYNLKKRNDMLLNIYDPAIFDINDNSFVSLNRELREKLLVQIA